VWKELGEKVGKRLKFIRGKLKEENGKERTKEEENRGNTEGTKIRRAHKG